MKLHLIQPQEVYGPPERQAELMECYRRNNELFDVVTAIHYRPTFAHMFALCEPDKINVIANSDIYFDHTLRREMPDRHVYALSRWDVTLSRDPGGTVEILTPYHKPDSQDAWIVSGGPYEIDAPFTMGVPGCDNAIAHILDAAGFTVTNPCKSIRAMHLHESGYRTYGEGRGKPKMYRIPPPYKLLTPCTL